MKWQRLMLLGAVLALAGCGQTSQVVQNWAITNNGTTISLAATLDPSYEINGEAIIPFKNYGTVNITQASNGQSTIGATLNVNSFLDNSLGVATTLPNNEPFPSIVTGSMLWADVLNNKSKWDIRLYFDRQAQANGTYHELVGVDIGNYGISTNFGSVTLTQDYFNSSNYKFASITFYGPVLNSTTNAVVVPGGIFLVADVNATTAVVGPNATAIMASLGAKAARTEIEVGGADAYKYPTAQSRQELFSKILASLKNGGVIRPNPKQ